MSRAQATSAEIAETLQGAPPKDAVVVIEGPSAAKEREPRATRSTTVDTPASVSEKVDAPWEDTFGRATPPHTFVAAASTADGSARATERADGGSAVDAASETRRLPETDNVAAAASSADVAFTARPRRADRMTPAALTRIASSHSGHSAGATDNRAVA